MAELIIELYSEEIPPLLQISAREQLKKNIDESLKNLNLNKFKSEVFSTPTRIVLFLKDLPIKIKIDSKEIKGPKVGVKKKIIENFVNSHNQKIEDIFEKNLKNGNFYFLKKKGEEILLENLLKKNLPNILKSLNWKKSMRWGNTNLTWGRPLRSILALFDGKVLKFQLHHLTSSNITFVEKDLKVIKKKITSSKNYFSFVKSHGLQIDQNQRKIDIISKFKKICVSRNLEEKFEEKLVNDVVNIVDSPSVLILDFDKKFLEIPSEIIISTLKSHQKFFPLFDRKKNLTNYFLVVINKKDTENIIKNGNKRVVDARLSDAKFFWDKDKSKNLIKQIIKLKKIKFYEKIGSIYDKTQRLRKMSNSLSDQLDLNKEKNEIAASISKADLCSDLVSEYPELQGKMGRSFALAQGFDKDIANAISEHYFPIGLTTEIPKRPISYSIAIVDKIDTLTGFFLINEKPTSSKDPFALRRSAIGLLRIIIENNLNVSLSNLISYNLTLYQENGVNEINKNTQKEILLFLKDRMKNILKEKKIKPDIIEASVSSHTGDNFLHLFKKNLLINKYLNKDVGKNAINSYKRAFNIIDKQKNEIDGYPDEVLFRKEEEKILYEKISEIKKKFAMKDVDKHYETILINLSDTKEATDNFFDKVVVNDDNTDIRNNRLQLLKMFCNTFNNFINFSKLEGVS